MGDGNTPRRFRILAVVLAAGTFMSGCTAHATTEATNTTQEQTEAAAAETADRARWRGEAPEAGPQLPERLVANTQPVERADRVLSPPGQGQVARERLQQHDDSWPDEADQASSVAEPVPALPRSESSGVSQDLTRAAETAPGVAAPAPGAQSEPVADRQADRSGAFKPWPVDGDIRTINFRNGFPYGIQGFGTAVVDDGLFELAGEHGLRLSVDGVYYGDVAGTSADDAVVTTTATWPWGTQTFATVYTIDAGQIERLGQTWTDFGFSSTIVDVELANRQIRMLQLSGDQTWVGRSVWEVTEAKSVAQVEMQFARTWFDLRSTGVPAPSDPSGHPPYSAAPEGGWRATIAVDGASAAPIRFEADAGWVLETTPIKGADYEVVVRTDAGQLVGMAAPGRRLQLDAPGTYQLAVNSGASNGEVFFDVDASDLRTLLAPKWENRSATEVVELPGQRTVDLTWPELTVAAGAVDIDAVNELIRSEVGAWTAEYENALQGCEPDKDSVYRLNFSMTLVSYDLISIRFDEFICLCEAGDTFEFKALIIDLNTATVVDAEDILDLQAASVQRAWLEGLGWHYGNVDELEVGELTITSIGAEYVTVAAMVDSGRGPFQTEVTLLFTEIADAANPDLVTRASSGKAVPLPPQHGCGC